MLHTALPGQKEDGPLAPHAESLPAPTRSSRREPGQARLTASYKQRVFEARSVVALPEGSGETVAPGKVAGPLLEAVAWPVFSTPSDTTFAPRARAVPGTSSLSPKPSRNHGTNERSISRTSTGGAWGRRAGESYPVPKRATECSGDVIVFLRRTGAWAFVDLPTPRTNLARDVDRRPRKHDSSRHSSFKSSPSECAYDDVCHGSLCRSCRLRRKGAHCSG